MTGRDYFLLFIVFLIVAPFMGGLISVFCGQSFQDGFFITVDFVYGLVTLLFILFLISIPFLAIGAEVTDLIHRLLRR